MKFSKLVSLLLVAFYISFLGSCSSSDESTVEDIIVSQDDDNADNEGDSTDGDSTDGDSDNGDDDDSADDDMTAELERRFVFDRNIVIENSYNTGGCGNPPCDTNDESLVGVFVNAVPDDNYFSLSEDQSELNLECQLEKGRRIEFKQISEGPLTSFSRIELEGVFYDIPNNGVTIAQVHNRGGSGNKPFFRLVLHEDGLETVIRQDPEVSSGDTEFDKFDFAFSDGGDYDVSSLKIVVEKSNGSVHINVEQNGVMIVDQSYAPDPTTRWVSNTGIANGFYLKAGLYNDDGPHTKNLVAGYSTVKFESNDQQ